MLGYISRLRAAIINSRVTLYVTDEGIVTHDDHSFAGATRSTGGRPRRTLPLALSEKAVPADTVESVKDSTVPLIPATQGQAAFRPRLARRLRL
jgi:hypothetical protein